MFLFLIQKKRERKAQNRIQIFHKLNAIILVTLTLTKCNIITRKRCTELFFSFNGRSLFSLTKKQSDKKERKVEKEKKEIEIENEEKIFLILS